MIGIKLRKFPSMRITVSMESAKFCPNLYRCTHQNCDSAEPTRTVRTYRRKAQLHRKFFDSSQQKKRKSCDLDGKHRKNVHFYCFRVCPNPICRRRAEGKAAMTTLSPPLKWTLGNVARIPNTAKEELLSKQNTICTLK